jgi:hypothetical protein
MKIGVFSPTLLRKFAFYNHVSMKRGWCETATYCQVGDVLCGLEVSKGSRSAGMYHPLKDLRSVECLLFLKQENVTSNGNTANVLAVCTAEC